MLDQDNTNHMLKIIESFVNGNEERKQFLSNFNAEYRNRISKMRLEDPIFANAMFHYVVVTGINASSHLSDGAFKALISKRYKDLLAARSYGEYKLT